MTFPKPSFSPAEPIAGQPVVTGVTAPPPPSGETRTSGLAEVARRAGATAAAVIPPLLTLLVILGVWQVAAGDSYVGLPSPAHVWMDSKDLILHPFFDHGGVDKGLFWHVLTSLKRVGIGFSISAVGVGMLGVLIG